MGCGVWRVSPPLLDAFATYILHMPTPSDMMTQVAEGSGGSTNPSQQLFWLS